MIYLEEVSDEHYYIVFGWKDRYMRNTADFVDKFDIYNDAVLAYKTIRQSFRVSKIYEVTDGIYTELTDKM